MWRRPSNDILFDAGRACAVLDGPKMRLGVSKDLGFTPEGRSENMRRAAECARILNDAGLITIASFLAPRKAGPGSNLEKLLVRKGFLRSFWTFPLRSAAKGIRTGCMRWQILEKLLTFRAVTTEPMRSRSLPILLLRPHSKCRSSPVWRPLWRCSGSGGLYRLITRSIESSVS